MTRLLTDERVHAAVQDYRIMLRRHLVPFFGQRPIDTIEAADIGDYIVRKRRSGLAMKTVTNHLQFAHGVFAFSMRRGWMRINGRVRFKEALKRAELRELRFHDLRHTYDGDLRGLRARSEPRRCLGGACVRTA